VTTLLRQNRELRPDRIWNWTLPAWYVTLSTGERFVTCPNAGACAHVCYARQGTYQFPVVLAAHRRNLERVLDDPDGWQQDMLTELAHKRFRPTGEPRTLGLTEADVGPALWGWLTSGGAAVRVHDSGDFFAAWYLDRWVQIATAVPDVLFYAYTKEVSMVREHEHQFPLNFCIILSTGGQEDHLIDPDSDRHADVFPDDAAITAHGYTSQDESDLLAVLLPTTRVGIPANNISAFRRRLAGRRFSELVPERLRMREVNQ
jgi:hypothetical protein